MAINIFVEIHGMNPSHNWVPYTEQFKQFQAAILNKKPWLEFDAGIYVDWGQETVDPDKGGAPDLSRPDTLLRPAKEAIYGLVDFDTVRKSTDSLEHSLSPYDSYLDMVDPYITAMKQSIVLGGFGDCAFYCSPEGEDAVRHVCYSKFLDGLAPFEQEEDVHLHIISHSLGVTVSHDFLYGLFGKAEQSYKDPRFDAWRKKAAARELKVGSFTSYASQLPVFLLRKRSIVQGFTRKPPALVDATEIGIGLDHQVRWQIFYDCRDPLGFPTRPLYTCQHAIEEFQVNNGLDFHHLDAVHTRYLDPLNRNEVFEKTCKLIEVNWGGGFPEERRNDIARVVSQGPLTGSVSTGKPIEA